MNFKALNILSGVYVLETFINKKNEISISINYEESSDENDKKIISLDFDDATALRDELSLLLDEINSVVTNKL